jgi:hypothetical protein
VNIPNFPECDHTLVQSLYHLSDRELVMLFKQNADAGRYFTAIFCRYSPIVYSLIRHSARSPVQAEYLFAVTWRHILHELGGLDWPEPDAMRRREKVGFRCKTGLLMSRLCALTRPWCQR